MQFIRTLIVGLVLCTASLRATPMYVIGDLHGDLDALVSILYELELIDHRGSWIGGKTKVILLGDLVGGDDDSRYVMDYAAMLTGEAGNHGGRVQTLLGNHDFLYAMGMPFWMTEGELASFAEFPQDPWLKGRWEKIERGFATKYKDLLKHDINKEHYRSWISAMRNPDSRYAKLFKNRPVAALHDGFVFLHAGPTPEMLKTSIKKMNRQMGYHMKYLQGIGDKPNNDWLWLTDTKKEIGPLSVRPSASEIVTQELIDDLLRHWNAEKIIVGHSPTKSGKIEYGFNDKLVFADTKLGRKNGMSEELVVLKIEDKKLTPITVARDADHSVSRLIRTIFSDCRFRVSDQGSY